MTKSIAIAGAGIVGLTLAHVLDHAGYDVSVYDCAGFPASNASYHAGGMLAPYGEAEYLQGEWMQAGVDGVSFWDTVQSIHDIGYKKTGSYYIAHTNDAYMFKRFLKHIPHDAHVQDTNKKAFHSFAEKIFIQNEAHLSPHRTLNVLSQNKDISYHVETFDFNDSSNFDYTIDCRGMGAQNDLYGLRAVKGEAIVLRNSDYTLDAPVRIMHPRYTLYVVPRDDHHFYIGATEIEAEDEKRTLSVRSVMELLSAVHMLHPSFSEADVVETITHFRPAFSDNLPRIQTNGNIISCNGIFRHGYLLSPTIAHIIKDMVDEREHPHYSLFAKD